MLVSRSVLHALSILALLFALQVVSAQDSSEEALAAYADAANLQTNGALIAAIEDWRAFLEKFPNDPMAPEASHFLGVCLMQKDEPDYQEASKAFTVALKNTDYELREESLVNQGWCLYFAAGEAPNRDKDRLSQSIDAFEKLRKEFPKSAFLDRALFYSGEAAYGLGDSAVAIKKYDALLSLPNAKDSPLRCDALYARGVAYEELDQFDSALASFKQLMSSCEKSDLVTDVHLRLGDIWILKKEFEKAVKSFEEVAQTSENEDDLSYALFRKAFALVQSNKPADAAKAYERLLTEYPDSAFAARSELASAQSIYRSGDLTEAAKRFEKVLGQKNVSAATEAAHWLARIALSKNDPERAKKVAAERIKKGVEGKFASELKLDYAEALSMNPATGKESLESFEEVYRDAPAGPLAPRALYNAAFSALQIGELQKAISLAKEFQANFNEDLLAQDVKFVSAEAQFALGKPKEASQSFIELVKNADPKDKVQRPIWILRAATSLTAAGQHKQTVALLKDEVNRLPQKTQQAEALMLLGQAYLMSEQADQAAEAFRKSHEADSKWSRASEALLMSGQALFAAGKKDRAAQVWTKIISDDPKSRMADQARYKLAQFAAVSNDNDRASKLYKQIVDSKADPGLIPYALYSRSRLLMDDGQYRESLKALNRLLSDFKGHPVSAESLLARGITYRNLDKTKEARDDLQAFLDLNPTGLNLGHGLYEFALVEQKDKKPEQAAKKLEQLVNKVPNYPGLDRVLYELGWSYRESGKDDEAVKTFTKLIDSVKGSELTSEAAYFVGQNHYEEKEWKDAAKYFELAEANTSDSQLSEKALYRLGWSHFKAGDLDKAESAFVRQAKKHANESLSLDALMMVGECRFNRQKFKEALKAYTVARKRIQDANDTTKSVRDDADRQARELVLLHGGQSAAQLKQWKEAIAWYDELRSRFPSTAYLAQVFYESAYANQQLGDNDRAIQLYGQVADNYRNELAARARFMKGEIYFGNRRFDLAIPEFQRVMFGFGAEKAPNSIKNWQAKSGFEAGRCAELLMQSAKTQAAKKKSFDFAVNFFQYVIEKHPSHELAEKSKERLGALKKK